MRIIHGPLCAGFLAAATSVICGAPAASAATLHTLASFDGNNGTQPWGSLTADADGNLYGTANLGGASNVGTVFKYTPGGSLTALATFDNTNGAYPAPSVVLDAAGNLYGATSGGGDNQDGSIFKVTPEGTLTTLFSFDNKNHGGAPVAGLIADTDGNLYGTTYGFANQ